MNFKQNVSVKYYAHGSNKIWKAFFTLGSALVNSFSFTLVSFARESVELLAT